VYKPKRRGRVKGKRKGYVIKERGRWGCAGGEKREKKREKKRKRNGEVMREGEKEEKRREEKKKGDIE
jgi:hypothetical protein